MEIVALIALAVAGFVVAGTVVTMLLALNALVWLFLLPLRLIGWMLLLPLLLLKVLLGVAIVHVVAVAGLVALAVAVVLPLLPLLLLGVVLWGVFAMLARPTAAARGRDVSSLVVPGW